MDWQNTKFDIIIQAGQSNAEGYGIGPADEAVVPKLSGNVWQIHPLKGAEVIDGHLQVTYHEGPLQIVPAAETQIATGMKGNFSLTFAQRYEEEGFLKSGRQLLIIRAAVGGTGFNDGLWGLGNPLHVKMVEMVDFALSLNPGNRVVGFLWHQGENEAYPRSDFDCLKKNIQDTFEDVRARYGAGIPIIAGDFVNDWKSKNLERCEPVIATIKEVIAEIGNGEFVETSDLESNGHKMQNDDDIHFCREALCILGKRYFEKYKNMEIPYK